MLGQRSAIVNTLQQIGGSIGTALLNTICIIGCPPRECRTDAGSLSRPAAICTATPVAFWWSAGFFGLGTIITLFMLESGATQNEPALLTAT